MDHELQLESNFQEMLEQCEAADVDELAARLKAALAASGFNLDLNGSNLRDPGKQEELVQLFGEGWLHALHDCLSLRPLEDATEDELVPEEDSLLDEAEALVLSLKRELGETDCLEEEEGLAATHGAAELMLLAELSPQQLVTKLVAQKRRQRLQKAAASEQVAATRRALAGERGRAPCLDTVLSKWPDVGDKIEAICVDLQVGADAARRDGAITLNRAVQGRTGGTGFKRIRIELEARYGIVLSARALRDLTVARDKRMRVASRYKCVVNLKMRRSVKRITQDNLDDHTSNATYRLLHYVRDRCSFDNTLWFQRDDHAKHARATQTCSTPVPCLPCLPSSLSCDTQLTYVLACAPGCAVAPPNRRGSMRPPPPPVRASARCSTTT